MASARRVISRLMPMGTIGAPAPKKRKRRLKEGGDMRFDADARVEVWVTADDVEMHDGYEAIVGGAGTEEQKIAALKQLAEQVAVERVNGVPGVTITASISLSDVNVDRIDWVALATPETYDNDEPNDA